MMRASVGGGWAIVHLTDRVVELRKEDVAYRRVLGRDGYVRVRAEPGMDRQAVIQKAIETAQANDAALALRLAKRLAPNLRQLAAFQGKQVRMASVMRTGQEPELIGAKRV